MHMMHLVEVCVCVFMHDNVKTIAVICFLLGGYVDWRWDGFACQNHITGKGHFTGKGQGQFSEGSRSLGNVMSCSFAGSKISVPDGFFTLLLKSILDLPCWVHYVGVFSEFAVTY